METDVYPFRVRASDNHRRNMGIMEIPYVHAHASWCRLWSFLVCEKTTGNEKKLLGWENVWPMSVRFHSRKAMLHYCPIVSFLNTEPLLLLISAVMLICQIEGN